MNENRRWWFAVLFAVAMAWMEAAVVFYLRTLVGRIDPYQARPLPVSAGLAGAEIVREAATMIMLGCVGCLAGRTWRSRIGYLLVAFGVWDIFYYVFTKIITGWPQSFLDMDVLAITPGVWAGPMISAIVVSSSLLILGIWFFLSKTSSISI